MKNRYSIIHFIYFSSLEIRNKNLKRWWARNLFVLWMELCVGEKQSVTIMSRQIEWGVDCWLCGRPVCKPTRGTGSGGVRAEDREVRRRVAEPAVTLSLAFKNSLSGLSPKTAASASLVCRPFEEISDPVFWKRKTLLEIKLHLLCDCKREGRKKKKVNQCYWNLKM